MKNIDTKPAASFSRTLRPRHRHLPALLTLALSAVGFTASAHGQFQYAPVVSTYAGGATTSTICSTATDTIGDGCVATSAILGSPGAGDVDAAGNIYFPDTTYSVIRRIDATTGIITLVAGQISSTTTTPVCSGALDAIGDGCIATQATFNLPRCVRIDRAGNIIIADVNNEVIRSINKTTGIITVLMGIVGKTSSTPPKNTAPVSPSATTLDNPYYMSFDPAGNMIVTNASGNFVPIAIAINGLIDPANSVVYNLAGTGGKANSGNGGLASAAEFAGARGLTLDSAENVYVADYQGYEIRRVTSPGANGQITLANITAAKIASYAGNGTDATTGNGGAATSAELTSPQAVDFDNSGNLLEQQSSVNVIRIVNPITGIINNYGGTGAGSFTGDGGPAAAATFNVPLGVRDNVGNRYSVFDNGNDRIRNIYPTPFFSPLATGSTSVAQNVAIQALAAITPATAATSNSEFTIASPTGCTLGTAMAANAYCTLPVKFVPVGPGLRSGQLQITDGSGNVYDDTLLGIGLSPAVAFYAAPITTIAGNGTSGSSGNGGAATSALVSAPRGGGFDSFGNFYFADSANNVIREISKKSGAISIVAGGGTTLGDGGAATSAQLNAPTGVALDPAGNLYIADAGNNRIREVSVNTGIINTIAGTGKAGYTGDTGSAASATLNDPSGIAIDSMGVLYIADTGNNALRAFSASGGIIVTLAGTGTAGHSGDGGVPQLATLNGPTAVTVDVSGNIYVADTGNAVVRRIVPVVAGITNFQANISTYAGSVGGTSNSGDGGPATSASLLSPSGLGVDAAGDLYIACGGQVRMVSSQSGIINTLAGTGAAGVYSGEGGSALAAVIPAPADNLTVDQVGNIYLSDTAGNRILSIASSSAAPLTFSNQSFGTTSQPQTTTLYNSGNQPLYITNITLPTAFNLSSTASNACTSTTTLAAGASCALTVTFSPPSVATYSSQITITDNALNSVTGSQVIPLVGIGVGQLLKTTTVVTYSPANPTYGQPVTVTATVSGGTSPSGQVNFVINGKTTVPTTLNSSTGQATYVLTGLQAGTDAISANYLGDSVNAGSSGSATLVIAPAILTVTANSFSIYPTQAIPTLTYSIAGFVYSDTVTMSTSGAPTLSTSATSASPVGTYPITISKGTLTATNYTFVLVAGVLTVLSPNFTIELSPTSLSLASGKAGSVTVTVTPSIGYSGTVTLTCGPLPADVLCTWIPSTLTVSGSALAAQLTITTNNFGGISSLRSGEPGRSPSNHGTLISLALALPILSISMFCSAKGRRRRLLHALMTLLLFFAMRAVTGCTQAAADAAAFNGNIPIIGTDTNKQTAQANLALSIQ